MVYSVSIIPPVIDKVNTPVDLSMYDAIDRAIFGFYNIRQGGRAIHQEV